MREKSKHQKKMKKKQRWKRGISILLMLLLLVSSFPQSPWQGIENVEAATLSNPRVKDGITTWDCVYFGNYYQSDKTGSMKDPIKWRVLSVDGNDAFLLADRNLDKQRYNTTYTDITWENCTLRSWLNSTFLNTAFTSIEQNAILDTTVINKNNPSYGTAGGNNTIDKVFALSIEEALTPSYGFTSNNGSTETRIARNTAYVAGKSGMAGENMGEWWWLRSPGDNSYRAAYVHNYGNLNVYGTSVSNDLVAVRPALHLNLSSSNLWSYAEPVSSDGGEEVEPPINPGDSDWDYGTSDADDNIIRCYIRQANSLVEMVDGATVSLEGHGEQTSDDKGKAFFENNLTEDISAEKRIHIKKEGYREYISDIVVFHQDAQLFNQNLFSFSMTELKPGDVGRPYISTVIHSPKYYKPINLLTSTVKWEANDMEPLELRMYGVWNGKTPSQYILYQEDGVRLVSEDGKFVLRKEVFEEQKKVYAQIISSDGTMSEAEETGIEIIKPLQPIGNEGNNIDLFPETSGSMLGDIPYLSNDSVKMKLAVPVTYSVKGDKVRLAVGLTEVFTGEENCKAVLADDENWKDWKKLCESAFTKDYSLTDWKNAIKEMKMSYTASVSLDCDVIGYYEINMNTDELSQEGGIILSADAKAKFQNQSAIGPVPVYVKFELGNQFETQLSGGYNYTEQKFYLDWDAEIEPYLVAEGGVGVLYVATVGVEGKGSMPIELSFKEGLQSLKLQAGLALKASVLGFTYKKAFTPKTWQLYPEEAKANSLDSVTQRDENLQNGIYELLSRDYANEPAIWYGESPRIATRSLRAKSETCLQSNIYPHAKPVITAVGDTYVATWIADNPERNAANRTMLVYSVYHKATESWSQPKAVADDETADFYPSVASDGENLWIAWQNISKEYTETEASLEEFAASSDICTARYDASSQTFVEVKRITADESINMMPIIACNNAGEAVVTWVKNTANDIYGQNGSNSIHYATLSNPTAQTLQDGLQTIVSMDAAYVDNAITVSYCVEKDGDLSTLEDRVIATKTTGKAVQELALEGMTSAPKYGTYQGQQVMFFYHEGGIWVQYPDGTIESVYTNETGSVSDDFTVISSKQTDELAVLWTSVTEGEQKQIVGVRYHPQTQTWSQEITLSDSEANVYFPSGLIEDDGTLLFMYNRTEEGLETSASDLCVQRVTPKYDVSIENVSYEENELQPNATIPLTIAVANNGQQPVNSLLVTINGQDTMISQRIEGGAKDQLLVHYTTPAEIEHKDVEITVTVLEGADVSPEDNTTTFTWGYADAALALESQLCSEGSIHHILISNETAIPTEGVLTIRKNEKDGEILETIPLASIERETIQTISYFASKDILKEHPDMDALYFVIDSEKEEKYYTNNYDFVPFTETTGQLPVLCESVTLNASSLTVEVGQTKQLNATVLPQNADNPKLVWKSSDETIATVSSSGLVTAKKAGNATITCSTIDGSERTASCSITCKDSNSGDDNGEDNGNEEKKPDDIKVTSIGLNKMKHSLVMGKSVQLKAELLPKTATQKAVSWSSSNKTIASVDKNGKVSALKPGEAKITCSATDGSGKSQVCTITVKPKQVALSNVKAGKKKATLKWKKVTGVSGYEIHMSKKKNKGYTRLKTIKKASKKSFTKTKLKPKKTYYFKVRAYKTVRGNKVYGAFSKPKKCRVK